MKLRILGAAGEVTGSNYLIETDRYKIIVDCGTYQGADEDKHDETVFDYNPADIDAVFLTHAHIDHSGRIPLLVKKGFKGKIYCTLATSQLVDILLHDSARIMAEDAQTRTRKNARRGLPPVEPLYNENDVEDALTMRQPVPYDERIDIMPGLSVRFREAGHILGSSIIETWISDSDDKEPVKVVFSGDLGQFDGVIEKPPAFVEDADYVLIESTYGDRLHKPLEDTRREFQEIMEAAVRSGGKVLIPTFVIDRAQRMLYEFKLLQKKLPDLKIQPIFLDSPMGVKATEIYSRHITLLSRDLKNMIASGDDPFEPQGFSYIRTSEQSREINERTDGIVLAGSGMCAGGRIMHHLRHNLFRSSTHLFFIGYQAYGTLGRRIVDKAEKVRIMGEEIAVRAQVHTLGGFSAHADRDDLLKWASSFPKNAHFIVVHGEPESAQSLAFGLHDAGYISTVPALGDEIDLKANIVTQETVHAAKTPQPNISQRILEHVTFGQKDAALALSLISERALSMQETLKISPEKYKDLMPLLISARTLLETAAAISDAHTQN